MKEILCLLALTGTIATISLTGCNKIADEQLQLQHGYKAVYGYDDIEKCQTLFSNEENIEKCQLFNNEFSQVKNTEKNRLTGFRDFKFYNKTATTANVSIFPIHTYMVGEKHETAKAITATLELIDGVWVIKHTTMI